MEVEYKQKIINFQIMNKITHHEDKISRMSTAIATPSRASIGEQDLSPNIIKQKLRVRSKQKQILKFKIKCSHKSSHSYHERGLIKRNDIDWITYNSVISIYHTWLRLAPFLNHLISKTNEQKLKILNKLTKAVLFQKQKMQLLEKKRKEQINQIKNQEFIVADQNEKVNYQILEEIKNECLQLNTKNSANASANRRFSKSQKQNIASHSIRQQFQNKNVHQKQKFNIPSNIQTITEALVNKIDAVKASKQKEMSNMNSTNNRTSKPSKREYRKSLFLEPISYFGIDKVNKKLKFKEKNWDDKQIKENIGKKNKMVSGNKLIGQNGAESDQSESFSNSSQPSQRKKRDSIEYEKPSKRNGSKNNVQVRWKSHLNKQINNSDDSFGSQKNRRYINGDDSYDKYHERRSILHREINKKKVLKQSKTNFNSRFNKNRDSKTSKNQKGDAQKKVRKQSKKLDVQNEIFLHRKEQDQTLANQNGKTDSEQKQSQKSKINESSQNESSEIRKTKKYKKGQFFLKRKKIRHSIYTDEQSPKQNGQHFGQQNCEDKCIEGYLRPKADSLIKLTNYVKTNGYLSNMKEDHTEYIKRKVLNEEVVPFVHRYHSEDERKKNININININKECRPYQFLTQLNKQAIENWLSYEPKPMFEKEINYFEVSKNKNKITNMDLDLDIPLIRKTGKKPEPKWLEKQRIALNLGFSIRKIMEANTISQKPLEKENDLDF